MQNSDINVSSKKVLIKWGSEFSSYEIQLRNQVTEITLHLELLTRKFSKKFFFRITN